MTGANRILTYLMIGVLAVSLWATPSSAATQKKKSSQPNNRYASIVIDAESGAIISQSNADKKLHPASLTKVMTLLLTFEALEKGTLNLRDRVRISQNAANMSPSKIGLPVGDTIRVEDAIYALVTKSANDIAVALAEKVGGNEKQFAMLMTRKAREIGMTNTRFTNASGWHDPAQVSSARDMARMAQYVIYRYPQYFHYFSTKNFSYRGKSYHNHNRLMSEYPGMDGLKTGYVAASGFNLVATAKRGNKRLIGVVFGGRSAASRNAHMATLLDRGFKGIIEDTSTPYVASSKITPKAPLVPGRKPQAITELAYANNATQIAPAAGQEQAAKAPVPYASMSALILSDEVSGQGDFDPADTKRLETGLIAVAAVKKELTGKPVWATSTATSAPIDQAAPSASGDIPDADRPWAIQVGAFSSRVQTDRAIRDAIKKLPAALAGNEIKPVIVPLKTADGWVFRGRIDGYSKDQAASACSYLRDCLTVSPDVAR